MSRYDISETGLKKFTDGYIECALWSSTDNSDESGGEPFDANYSKGDIADETLAQMKKDCKEFYNDNYEDLVKSGLADSRAGHDFWLTRNRHGSGYWDEYFGDDKELRAVFDRLTKAAHVYGSFDLYVGDDGEIYGN